MDSCIIECYPQAIEYTTKHWIFNRLQTDRQNPSGLQTVKGEDLVKVCIFKME